MLTKKLQRNYGFKREVPTKDSKRNVTEPCGSSRPFYLVVVSLTFDQ